MGRQSTSEIKTPHPATRGWPITRNWVESEVRVWTLVGERRSKQVESGVQYAPDIKHLEREDREGYQSQPQISRWRFCREFLATYPAVSAGETKRRTGSRAYGLLDNKVARIARSTLEFKCTPRTRPGLGPASPDTDVYWGFRPLNSALSIAFDPLICQDVGPVRAGP